MVGRQIYFAGWFAFLSGEHPSKEITEASGEKNNQSTNMPYRIEFLGRA
jgi:hypothetical protein